MAGLTNLEVHCLKNARAAEKNSSLLTKLNFEYEMFYHLVRNEFIKCIRDEHGNILSISLTESGNKELDQHISESNNILTLNQIDNLFSQGAKVIYILDENNISISAHIAHNNLSKNIDKLTYELVFPNFLETTEASGCKIYLDKKLYVTLLYINPPTKTNNKDMEYNYKVMVWVNNVGHYVHVDSEFPIEGDAIRPFIAYELKMNMSIDISNGFQILGVDRL